MSRDITPFALRMSPELRQKVEESAKQNKRSLNAEITARLESTFPENAGTPPVPPKLAEQLAFIDNQVAMAMRDKVIRAIDEAIAEAAQSIASPKE